MSWEPSQPLRNLVRGLTDKRVREYLQKREPALQRVRDAVRQRLPGNSALPEMVDEIVRLTKELLDDVLVGAVDAVRKQGPLTDESEAFIREWLSGSLPASDALWGVLTRYDVPPHQNQRVVKENLGRELDRIGAEVLSDLGNEVNADKVAAGAETRLEQTRPQMAWQPSAGLRGLADAFRKKRLAEYCEMADTIYGDTLSAAAQFMTGTDAFIVEELARRDRCLRGLVSDLTNILRERNALTAESGEWVRCQVVELGSSIEETRVDRGVRILAPGHADVFRERLDRGLGRTIESIGSDIRIAVERQALAVPTGNDEVRSAERASMALDQRDEKIIAALKCRVEPAAASYEQAILDLAGERLSWRGPACDLREALVETLDFLAPDTEVTAQPGFQFEGDRKAPTRRQQVRFVLRQQSAGKKLAENVERAVDVSEDLFGQLVTSVYDRSSTGVHRGKVPDKSEVANLRDLVRVALHTLLGLDGGAGSE